MEKAQLFKISRENMEWFKENYEDILKKYDNQWILIHNKSVAKSAGTFAKIVNVAKKYDPNTVLVEYMQSKPVAMFF